MFEAVIFDWDGTLVNSRKAIVGSFQEALDEVGCKVPDEFIARRMGTSSLETLMMILKEAKVSFDDELIKHLSEERIRFEMEMSDKVILFDGTTDLLASLKGKVKLALATSNNREVIDHLLKMKDVRSFFDTMVTIEDIKNSKPNPEIFLKCASELNVRPERCVVVEDSIFGVKAAEAAKMGCIAVLTGVYSREELATANPGLTVQSVKEKTAILRYVIG